MARIFRALLIAAVNTIKEFFAFATKECLEAGLKNATIVGELNNEDGVFSGFSSSSGIVTSTTFSNTFNTFEILMKIKTSNNITDNQIFFSTTASTSCEIALNVWSGTFAIFLSSNGQSWDIANAVHGSYSVLPNTDYYVKLVYNGSNYVFSYSLDGATFIDDITIDNSTKVGSFTPTIGNWVKNGTNPDAAYFSGYIDMKNTSVTIDGQTTYFCSTIPEVNDNINLNDGMATSNYAWSAYPVGVKNGTYTQTGTVEAIKEVGGNTVYATQEPQQDNKDISIKAGEIYYAYTNTNDESVYTTDDPISKETFILENATNNGCTDLGNGIYQCSPSNNITTSIGTDIQTASKWEICCKYNNQSASGYPTIFAPADSSYTQNPFLQLVSNKMYLFLRDVNGDDIIQGDTGYTLPSGFHLIQVGWTGTKYYMNVDGDEKWYYNSSVATKSNQDIMFLNLMSYNYWGYAIDMSQTSITIDNTTTNFGYFSNPSVLYENTGTTEFTPEPLEPQPEFELGTGVIATDLQNGALVIPVHEIHNSMEMVIHFKTGSSWPNLCLCNSSKDGTERNPSVYFQNYNIVLKAWLYSSSYTSGDADIANDYSVGFTLDLNTEYWFKTTWDGTTYKFYKSTNGNDYTIGNTLNSTVPINWNNNNLYLGNIYNTSVSDVYKNIYLNGTYIKVDGETIFNGSTAVEDIDFTNTGCTLTGFASNTIKIGNNLYKRNSNADDAKSISGVTIDIDAIDNTTIQSVTITSDQTATIETSANITTSNNDTVITDGSYHLFNLTIPTDMTPIIESSGISYQPANMPLLLKSNTGVGLLIKDNNNSYYRNYWVVNRDYDLHYQQINFSYPSGATVTCKVNNAEQSNLAPYVYCGDIVSWTCDNSGTITTGTYTVKYSNLDGNIQTITIS